MDGAAHDPREKPDRVEVPLELFEFDPADAEDEAQHDGENDDRDQEEPDPGNERADSIEEALDSRLALRGLIR